MKRQGTFLVGAVMVILLMAIPPSSSAPVGPQESYTRTTRGWVKYLSKDSITLVCEVQTGKGRPGALIAPSAMVDETFKFSPSSCQVLGTRPPAHAGPYPAPNYHYITYYTATVTWSRAVGSRPPVARQIEFQAHTDRPIR